MSINSSRHFLLSLRQAPSLLDRIRRLPGLPHHPQSPTARPPSPESPYPRALRVSYAIHHGGLKNRGLIRHIHSCATRAACSLSTLFTLYLFNTMHLVDKGRSACPAAAWGVKRAGSRACCLSDLGCCLSDLLYGLRIARRCQPRRVHVFLVQRAPLWHALEDEMIDVRGFDYLPRQCSTARAGPVW